MNTTYEDFKAALEFLVRIEPEPDTYEDMEEYDRMMAPYQAEIDRADATIRAYGESLVHLGLEHMESVLYKLLEQQTDPKALSIMRFKVRFRWNGLGEWQA